MSNRQSSATRASQMPSIRRLWFCAVLAPAIAAQPPERAIDEYLAARASLGQFNGTALVAINGSVVFEKAYGLADFTRNVKATASTKYEFASLTKAFTAAAILRLQEAGKLTVADSLCRWVERCPDAWKPLTLGHLLHHSSGIPDYEESLDVDSKEYLQFMLQPNSAQRIIERARTPPLEFAPGSRFKYSNTGYVVLGAVIERASGQTYDQYLSEQILKPAALAGIAFPVGAPSNDLANGYSRVSDDMREVAAGIELNMHTLASQPALPLEGPHGDGKLRGTARDLWKWTRVLEDSTLLSGASVRAMLTPGAGGYGMGWYIGSRYGEPMISHTGYLPGYASTIEWYPRSHTTVILVTNVVGPRLPLIARDLGAIAFGKPYDIRQAHRAVAIDTVAARELVGTYTLADGRTANVTLQGDLLVTSVAGAFNAGAFALSRDEYYAPFFENTVRFERDASGAGVRIFLRVFGETWEGQRKPPGLFSFVTMLGADTVGAERFERTATSVVGDLMLRAPRTRIYHYDVRTTPSHALVSAEITTRTPASAGTSEVPATIRVAVRGDSVFVERTRGDSVVRAALKGSGKIIQWFSAQSVALWDLVVQAAAPKVGDSVEVAGLRLDGSKLFRVYASRTRSDSARVDYESFDIATHVGLGVDGHVNGLDGTPSTIKIRTSPVKSLDLASLAEHFGSDDARGNALGTLSPRDTARASFGRDSIVIDYGRPSKRGRDVWASLLSPTEVWRLGANAATGMRTTAPLVLADGVSLPAGSYTIWLIPGTTQGTFIINGETGQWGTKYDRGRDVVQFPIRFESIAAGQPEQFTIRINVDSPRRGSMFFEWDGRRYVLPFSS